MTNDTDTILSHFRTNKLLAGMSDTQLQTLSAHIMNRELEAEEVIFREGDEADFIYLITSGEVEIYKEDERFVLAALGPGDTFGAIALLGKGTRTACARTRTPVSLSYFSISEIQQLAAESQNSIYFRIIQNHIRSSHDIIRKSDEKILQETKFKLREAKAKVAFSNFFTSLMFISCFYIFLLRNSIDWIMNESIDSTFVTSGMLVVFALVLFMMIIINGYPLWRYGLNMIGWKRSLKESLLWTAIFIASGTLIKWIGIQVLPGLEETPLFGFTGIKNYGLWEALFIAGMYAVFAPVQEFVARGVIQGSMVTYMAGKYRIHKSVFITTALFSSTHMHLDTSFALVVVIPSIFWGYMYARHRTLLGVCVSHVLIGLWFIFIMGY